MQQEVKRKQNEPQMLCIQFAAKVYCNKAEKLNLLKSYRIISAEISVNKLTLAFLHEIL